MREKPLRPSRIPVPMSEKIKTLEELETRLEAARKQGNKIVFTNGCFDLLHVGHIRYLQQARRMGDLLVVGVNSDESVRRLKGPSRPVQPSSHQASPARATDSTSSRRRSRPTREMPRLRS